MVIRVIPVGFVLQKINPKFKCWINLLSRLISSKYFYQNMNFDIKNIAEIKIWSLLQNWLQPNVYLISIDKSGDYCRFFFPAWYIIYQTVPYLNTYLNPGKLGSSILVHFLLWKWGWSRHNGVKYFLNTLFAKFFILDSK